MVFLFISNRIHQGGNEYGVQHITSGWVTLTVADRLLAPLIHGCIVVVAIPLAVKANHLAALQSQAASSLGTNHFHLMEKGGGIEEGCMQDAGCWYDVKVQSKAEGWYHGAQLNDFLGESLPPHWLLEGCTDNDWVQESVVVALWHHLQDRMFAEFHRHDGRWKHIGGVARALITGHPWLFSSGLHSVACENPM